jgi:hypothetical protein
VWTSLLPRSTRHWLPVIDHPRAAFSSNITLTVSSGYEAVATGMLMDRNVLDAGNVVYTFRTEQAVPASSLSFAVGLFRRDQTSFGLKRISFLTEPGLITPAVPQNLLETARGIMREVQSHLGHEFPYEALHIVLMSDHYWEPKSWGASTVFLYQNRGDLEAQLRRGIYGQWFGVYQREEQWSDAEAISIYQAIVQNQLVGEEALLQYEDVPANEIHTSYAAFSPSRWNHWQKYVSEQRDSVRMRVIARSIEEVLQEGDGVYTWSDYARLWYRQSGQPLFAVFGESTEPSLKPMQDSARSDSIVYRVDYAPDEAEESLKLTFTALKGGYSELVSLPLIQYTSSGADTLQVTFTGTSDSVVVGLSPMAQNVHIDASARPGLYLKQYKPASYLIYTLRNVTSVAQKKQAAEMLGAHANNPDLQLAIRDYLSRNELEPEVKAALLRSLADITKGATGTEQIFINALSSNNGAVQRASLMALQHYPENELVRETVKSFAVQSDSLPVFKDAVKIFAVVADTSAFDEFIRQIVRTDTAGYRAIYAIQEWANFGEVDVSVRQGEFYISEAYDYPVRAAALRLLLQHDHTPASWETRLEELLKDPDPRIRYILVRGLPSINGLNPSEVLMPYVEDEYDARVHLQMKKVTRRE